ncbi:hypothetical protein FQN53_004615 [Emmonsiellopsis sp. PD_33]|nr:hypothetical protein FQN53_004615 [Emmonsiellopsis sp. PD_33]
MAGIDASTGKGDIKAIGSEKVEAAAEDEQVENGSAFSTRDNEWHASYTKKLLRRLDMRLLPLVIPMYLLNFLDRSNLAQARLGTLEKDLGMTGTDFNLATSIFFVGYLLMQLPSNLVLTRVKPSVYLGGAMILWGVVSTAQAGVKSFGGLMATRICLGLVEAPFFPGVIMLMSSWYTTEELTHRIAWFYSGNALANMFGGLLGAGILGNLEGARGIAGWRWLFIIEGTVTIAVAIVAMIILPNFPSTSRWLDDEERAYAEWRLLNDAKEADDSKATTLWEGLKMVLVDWRLYVFVLFQHTSILAQTFQYFFPSIVNTLGFGKIETLLLTVPVWFLTFLVSLFVTYTSGRTGDRSIHIISLMAISTIGNIIATATTKTGARFFAMFLMPLGAVAAYQIIVSWVATCFPRPMVKRSSAIAICNMVGNTASIYGSYMYPSDDAPQYIPGGTANAVVCVLVALMAVIVRLINVRENKKLERLELEEDIVDAFLATTAAPFPFPAPNTSPGGISSRDSPNYHTHRGALAHVNPLIGTSGPSPNSNGGMIPSVAPPFAMTRWTAQTRENFISQAPYHSHDPLIHGFQATHQPAIWMGEAGQVVLVPGMGGGKEVRSLFEERGLAFKKEEERSTPYVYEVRLDGRALVGRGWELTEEAAGSGPNPGGAADEFR